MAAHPDGRPANGGTRCAREPAHHRTARSQRSPHRRSRRACCSRGRAATFRGAILQSVPWQSCADGIQRPDGSDCLDANASFLDLVGATREAVLAGRAQWWSDPKTDSALHDALAGRRLVRGLAGEHSHGCRRHCAKCSSRQRIWNSAMLPTTSLSFRTSPIACVLKMNFARRKRWKPSAASPPASLTTSTTCSPSSSDTPR